MTRAITLQQALTVLSRRAQRARAVAMHMALELVQRTTLVVVMKTGLQMEWNKRTGSLRHGVR